MWFMYCLQMLRAKKIKNNILTEWKQEGPKALWKFLSFLIIHYQITLGEFSSTRTQRHSSKHHMTSLSAQRIKPGCFFKNLVLLRVERTTQFSEKSQIEKRSREIQKLSLSQQTSLNGKLTLLDAAKRKPSTPPPGLLRSWLIPDDSQCTAGPRSGLWLTMDKQSWTWTQSSFPPKASCQGHATPPW